MSNRPHLYNFCKYNVFEASNLPLLILLSLCITLIRSCTQACIALDRLALHPCSPSCFQALRYDAEPQSLVFQAGLADIACLRVQLELVAFPCFCTHPVQRATMVKPAFTIYPCMACGRGCLQGPAGSGKTTAARSAVAYFLAFSEVKPLLLLQASLCPTLIVSHYTCQDVPRHHPASSASCGRHH